MCAVLCNLIVKKATLFDNPSLNYFLVKRMMQEIVIISATWKMENRFVPATRDSTWLKMEIHVKILTSARTKMAVVHKCVLTGS